jgi:hypothetical protein
VTSPTSEARIIAAAAAMTAGSLNASAFGAFVDSVAANEPGAAWFAHDVVIGGRVDEDTAAALVAQAFELWAAGRLTGAVSNVD